MTSNKVHPPLMKFTNVLSLVSSLTTIIIFALTNLTSKIAGLVVAIQAFPSAWVTFKRKLQEECYEIADKVVKCTVHTEPEETLVDVIFIHGLGGEMSKTWRQGTWEMNVDQEKELSKLWRKSRKKNQQKYFEVDDISKCWPIDWIPQDCKGARIISVDYITGWLWCPPFIKEREGNNMLNRSNEMIEELIKLGVGKKPIVWIGHSKGGLYVKQILVNAWENQIPKAEGIFRKSRAIAWYGVPHKGSTVAHYTLPLLRRSVPLTETKLNCDSLLRLHRTFLKLLEENKNIKILSFMETKRTLVANCIHWQIIPLESADPNVGRTFLVPVDHVEICEPRSRNCYLYVELIKAIKKSTEPN